MKLLSKSEVHNNMIEDLGLDSKLYTINSIEVVAGALRRSASLLCPCTNTNLIRSVLNPMRGLVDDIEDYRHIIESTLDALIAYGDVLEHHGFEDVVSDESGPQLFAAPPSFIPRESGLVIIVGVSEDNRSGLSDVLHKRLEYSNHVRRLRPVRGEDLISVLAEHELIRISYAKWIKSPSSKSPEQLIEDLNLQLDVAVPSRDVPGLTILDTSKPVKYYRGRWRIPHLESGRFIARREQAYGAPIWCYVKLQRGKPQRLIDLPISRGIWRGCDEGWNYQLSIDLLMGELQVAEVIKRSESTHVAKLYSPLPSWVQRRWDAVGKPVDVGRCLFAYEFQDSELDEELSFMQNELHLQVLA